MVVCSTLIYAMDTATRYSAAYVVQSPGLEESVLLNHVGWHKYGLLTQYIPMLKFAKVNLQKVLELYNVKL